jgi:orotate phosphoribosyltransferase
MESRKIAIPSRRSNIQLKVIPGHFATRNSHINYYLDITAIRVRQKDAKDAASTLVQDYSHDTAIDTIVCLDGTEIIGAFLAERLSEQNFYTRNTHHSAYIITPEVNQIGQWFFRENMLPMLKDKNVVLLMASITTGITIKQSLEFINFYGGHLQGISAIFSTIDHYHGLPVNSIFTKKDIPDYHTYSRHDCPYCQQGQPLEALVNGSGYSEIKRT